MKTISSRPRVRWHIHLAVLALASLFQAGLPGTLVGQATAVGAAVAAEDWADVARRLASNASSCDGVEPAHRMLFGHARLLTNATNEAVDAFYGCRTSDHTNAATEAEWLSWAEDFAHEHPRLAVAHFLLGDARARRGDLVGSTRALDRAIQFDPRHAGARNARGVVRWLLFESGGPATYELDAIADLEVAAERGLADAWANRGVIALRDGSTTDFARRMFDEALLADSQYWMAVNGQAVSAAAAGAAPEYARILTSMRARGGSTPFTPLNDGRVRLADTDLGGARGADNFSVAGGFEFKVPFGNTIKGNLDIQWRGGVFLTVAEGVNLRVHEDGEAAGVVGTWFALNYPGPEQDAVR